MKEMEIKSFILEITPHLIQPYPYVQFEFVMSILGNDVTYSLNMLLFIISICRLYILIRFLLLWLPFSSNQSHRVL